MIRKFKRAMVREAVRDDAAAGSMAWQEILPHPFDPEQRIFPMYIQRAEKKSENEPIISFVATDGSEDRHGSRINPNGWDLASYKRNPVILWGHDQKIPAIGSGVEIALENGRMSIDVRFAVDEWDVPGMGNLAMLLFRLAEKNVIRAMSTSFIPKKWRDLQAETIPSFFAENVYYEQNEMTENSIVNVPSNRNALKKAISDSIISENEATLLGLDAMFRLVPTPHVNARGADAPSHTSKAGVVHMGEAQRCGECYPAPPPPPAPVAPEVAATEIETMNALASNAIDQIGVALQGWESAEHDELRGCARTALYDNVYLYDRLRYLAREWYGENLAQRPADLVDELVSESADVVKARGILSSERTPAPECYCEAGPTMPHAAHVVRGQAAAADPFETFLRSQLGSAESHQNSAPEPTPDANGDESTLNRFLAMLT